MDLAFPEISAPAAPVAPPSTAIAVQAVTLKGAALAHFDALEAPLRALAERYRAVAFDVSTPKGLAAAKKAREDLRENGRYAVQRAEAEFKTAVNDAKKAVAPKVEQLVAIIKPVEDSVDAQIKAREAAIEEEKRAEAARKAAHLENITLIAGWAQRAHGQPADKLAGAIAFVEGIDVSEAAFEEFAPAAEKAKAEVLAKLNLLHEEAIESARVRAENEARERTIKLIAAITNHVAGGIGETSAALDQRLVSLKALVPATDAAGEVMTAYLTATAQIEAMLGQAWQREDLQRQLDEARAAKAAAAPAPAPVAPAEPEKPAQEPETALPVDSGGTGEPVAVDAYQPSEALNAEVAAVADDGPVPATGELVATPEGDRGPARLIAAEALARQVGACQIAPDRFALDVGQLADLIDAARA